MKKNFFGYLLFLMGVSAIAFSVESCGNGSTGNSSSQYTEIAVVEEAAVVEPEVVETPIQEDFVTGGHTYKGVQIKENAGLNMNEHSETYYTIQCFKDGTMIWSDSCTYGGGFTHKFDGEWKQNSGSKHDNAYVWYEFWATTYGMSGGHISSHYSMIGFIDEDGNLYDKFSIDDPIMAIHNQKSVCKLEKN